MKFKINWGWGIVIFLFIFVASILIRIYIANQQQINLVTPEYYPKGIAYEDDIKKKNNYKSLEQRLSVVQNNDNLIVTLPGRSKDHSMSGTVLVYHPANYEDDSLFTFQFDDSIRVLEIPISFMKRGVYEIQADWQEDSVFYYAVESIYVNK